MKGKFNIYSGFGAGDQTFANHPCSFLPFVTALIGAGKRTKLAIG